MNLSRSKKENIFLLPGMLKFQLIVGPLTLSYVIILAILVAFTIVVGIYTYSSVANDQQAHFNSMSHDMHLAIINVFNDYQFSASSIASMFAVLCPHAVDWPHCGVPLEFVTAIDTPLLIMNKMKVFGMMSLVNYSHITEFESWAFDFISNGGFPNGTGMSPSGFGIYMKNATDQYHTTANYSFSEYPYVMTPMIVSIPIEYSWPAIMYDIHSEEVRAKAIDTLIAKASSNVPVLDESELTDIIQLVQDPAPRPAAIMFHPIAPFNEPSKLVGLIAGVFYLDDLLTLSMPNRYAGGIECRVRTATRDLFFTMSNSNGVVYVPGGKPKESIYTPNVYTAVGCSGCNSYEFTFYPCAELFDSTVTSPSAIAGVAVALVTSLIIVLTAFYILAFRQTSLQLKLLDAKRAYVRFISHEVRTPMNTITLGLGLLRREMDTAFLGLAVSEATVVELNRGHYLRWKSLVDDVNENSSTAVAVLSDLLDYDKIESSTLTLQLKPFEIIKLVQSIVKSFAPQAEEKKLNILLEYDGAVNEGPPEHYLCWGDRSKLSQVLRNLISNALKFSPRSADVTIHVIHVESAGIGMQRNSMSTPPPAHMLRNGCFKIIVCDKGAGISAENQKRLFAKGVQFNPNELQAGNGSGLGLFIAKGIARLHGGDITASSKGENLGSEFSLMIPSFISRLDNFDLDHESVDSGSSSEHRPIPTEDSEPMNSDGDSNSSEHHFPFEEVNTILVVDDAAPNRKMLSRMLMNLKPSLMIAQAEDGKVAVDMIASASESPYDLILMDYEMPLLNGPSACRIIRNELQCKSMIIGITGNALASDIAYFEEHGADAVMIKPLNIELLHRLVRRLFLAKAERALAQSAIAASFVTAAAEQVDGPDATSYSKNDNQC